MKIYLTHELQACNIKESVLQMKTFRDMPQTLVFMEGVHCLL